MRRLYWDQDRKHRYRIIQDDASIKVEWTNCPSRAIGFGATSELSGQVWVVSQGDTLFGMVAGMTEITEASPLSAFYYICNYLSRLDYAYAQQSSDESL